MFVFSKQQDNFFYLNISLLIDKNSMERYMAILETQTINWDSFQFKIEAFDETDVNMNYLLFNVFSDSNLNSASLK